MNGFEEVFLLEGISRKIKIIVNPLAGGGKGRKVFPLLRQKLLERKIPFHLQFAESAEHTTLLARQAQSEGTHIIISCGGDGTAHRALQSLVGTQAVLGFIPLGKANDLPKNLELPEDLDLACNLLHNGKIRKIDVIQINSGEYMAGVGGVGFSSEVKAFSRKIGRFFGGESFPALLKTLTYRPKQISLRLDNENKLGPAFLVAFGNMRSYGKGREITPLAESDDGLLDICWIDPVNKIRLHRILPTVHTGKHLEWPEVHYFRTTAVRVESLVPLDLFGDGEFLSKTPFTLRVLPRALRVLVP